MQEQWAIIWATRQRDRHRDKTGSLDDPLDGPEWDGLRWSLPVFSFLLSRGDRAKPRSTRKPWGGAIVRAAANPSACNDEASLSR